MHAVLTRHAHERLHERFPQVVSIYPELKTLNTKISNRCVCDLIESCEDDKTVLNDTAKMVHLYETYGYDNDYKFMVHPDYAIEFVLIKERKEHTYRVVTVFKSKKIKKTNFKRVQPKSQKRETAMLDHYGEFEKKYCTVNVLNSAIAFDENDLKFVFADMIDSMHGSVSFIEYINAVAARYIIEYESYFYTVYYNPEIPAMVDRISILGRTAAKILLADNSPTVQLRNKLISKIAAGRLNLVQKISNTKKIYDITVDFMIYRVLASKGNINDLVILDEAPVYKYV